MLYRSRSSRRAVAATEMAFLAPVLLTFLMGLWEVGRYVMMQNVLDSAAREAARLAASGAFFSSNNHNASTSPNAAFTLPPPSTNVDYELQKMMNVQLQGCGVVTTGMTVTIANKGTSASSKNWSYTWTQSSATVGSGTGSGYDPSASADKADQLVVTVTLPYSNVTWSPLSWFVPQATTMSATTTWLSMNDTPLTVSTTIISKPLGASDPLP